MTTFAWLGLIVVVAIAAFFLGSMFTKKQLKHDDLEQQVQQAKHELEQYRQEVADHLASTKKLMTKMHQLCSGTVKFESGNRTVLDLSKAKFIKEKFNGKKIAIFYKFQAELTALSEVFGDGLCTTLEEFDSTDKNIALQIVEKIPRPVSVKSQLHLLTKGGHRIDSDAELQTLGDDLIL